jgi:C4-dicarboxylate-specific signal transduction histidine kinase
LRTVQTVPVVVLGLLCAALLVALLLDRRQNATDRERLEQTHQAERDAWRDERRELLTRVQHPALVPVGRREPREPKEPPRRDQSGQVGQVVLAAVGDNDESA